MTVPPSVRLAKNADGPRIGGLLQGMEFRENLDWSDIEPYWLVAEIEGRIVGALQIILGKPVGWMELMSVDPDLSHRQRAMTCKALTDMGFTLLGGFGAQMIMGSVPHDLESYQKVARKRGWVVVNSGNLFAKRVL